MIGRRHIFVIGAMETGWVHANWMYTSRWSCRCSPTPGTWAATGIPSDDNNSESPTPDNCSSCGELMDPPHKMTSAAFARRADPRTVYSTPVARAPSITTRPTIARVTAS